VKTKVTGKHVVNLYFMNNRFKVKLFKCCFREKTSQNIEERVNEKTDEE